MKLIATLKVTNNSNVQNLVKAFYEDFNPKNKMLFVGDVINLEIYYNKESIKIEEYFKLFDLVEYKKDLIVKDEMHDEESKKVKKNDTISKVKVARIGRPCKNYNAVNCEKLNKLVSSSASYDELLENVCINLNLDEVRCKKFQKIFPLLKGVESLNRSILLDYTKENQIEITNADISCFDYRAKTRFGESIFVLLNTIIQKRNCEFNITDGENKVTSDDTCKFPIIPDFEKRISEMSNEDKRKKIKMILEIMGIERQSTRARIQILKVVMIAVNSSKKSFWSIFKEGGFIEKSEFALQAIVSEFVNDFVSQYYPDMKVSANEFLKYMIKVV